MKYTFRLLAKRKEPFEWLIAINSSSSFTDLNDTLIRFLQFEQGSFTNFCVCDDQWNKSIDITPVENIDGDQSNYLMDKTKISDIVNDGISKFLYIYDQIGGNKLYLELIETTDEEIDDSLLLQSIGIAPEQYDLEDVLVSDEDLEYLFEESNNRELDNDFSEELFDDMIEEEFGMYD